MCIQEQLALKTRNPLTLPDPQRNRDIHYCIRLTWDERAKLNELARQLKLPMARMVRHFLFQAVEFYIAQQVAVENTDANRA